MSTRSRLCVDINSAAGAQGRLKLNTVEQRLDDSLGRMQNQRPVLDIDSFDTQVLGCTAGRLRLRLTAHLPAGVNVPNRASQSEIRDAHIPGDE
ncbi:MAG TPA: hypothetical protein VEK55_08905, partial [Xanthobacteraceae bacterium]|nr:hypothetical protein [Xanthobacteraceae bacterium]